VKGKDCEKRVEIAIGSFNRLQKCNKGIFREFLY
jgi:hypothetical protein